MDFKNMKDFAASAHGRKTGFPSARVLAALIATFVLLSANCLFAEEETKVFVGDATPAMQVSNTVENLCPKLAAKYREDPDSFTSAQADLLFRCGEVKIRDDNGYEGLSDEQKSALSHMTTDETSTMSTVTVEISSLQIAALTGRLATLRSGSPGRFAMNVNGKDAEPLLFAGPITSLGSSDQGAEDFGRLGLFVTSAFGTGDKDATDREPGFDYDSWGVTAGLDYRFTDSLILGTAVGYGHTKADLDGSRGDLEPDGYGVSVYGTYYIDNFYIDAIGGLGWTDHEQIRRVNYSVQSSDPDVVTTVSQKFKGDTDSDEYSFSVGAGYTFNMDALSFGPYARGSYLKSEIDGFSEKLENGNTDPGHGLAIELEDQDIESFTTALGGQVAYVFSTNIGVLTPYMRLEWEHEYENDQRDIKGRFINSLADDPSIEEDNVILITTDDPDRDYFNFGLGLTMVFPNGFLAFFDYETMLGLEDIDSHLFSAGLRFEY